MLTRADDRPGFHREHRRMRGNHFNKLSAFVAVAEQRNFTRAAVQLGIKASALSQSIRSLEEELGVRLTAEKYLTRFALPNFYFHVTTAYDILRHNRVALGKRDYLGKLSQD
jgi:hypothetical protein